MRLILIRHGDPNYEKDCLTEKGKREAALLAQRTARWKVDDVYVSPQGRARETAEPSLNNWQKEAVTLAWAREFVVDHKIVWDYLPDEWTADGENFCENDWVKLPRTSFAREEYENVCKNLDALLADYGYRREGRLYRVDKPCEKTLVVFCHFGISMMFLSHLLNLPAMALLHGFCLPTTSVTVLNTEERKEGFAYFRTERLGDTTHLFVGGEPVSQMAFFSPVMQEVN